jgi:hypothetical protein
MILRNIESNGRNWVTIPPLGDLCKYPKSRILTTLNYAPRSGLKCLGRFRRWALSDLSIA